MVYSRFTSPRTRERWPRRLLLSTAMATGLLFGSGASAQELLFSLTNTSGGSGPAAVAFSTTSHSSLDVGTQVTVPLPDGSTQTGSVIMEHGANPLNDVTMLETTGQKVISLDDGGSVELHLFNDSIVGMTITDLESQTFHRTILNSEGTGVLIAEDPNAYICAHMPMPSAELEAQTAHIEPEEVPSLSTVQNLQSKPGAPKVLYIDYWGGSLTGSAWNTSTGFATINYAPYSLDGSTAYSNTELYYMYQAWQEAAEDYAPFNVNVTTRASIFAAASNANKSRIIATTTATRNTYNLCNGCGGVAYVGQYGGSILYQTGWTFNSGLTSMGMTHSHEAGHQMGLSHDGGTANPSYYSGHGDWGPVMGAPFGKRYVQWSKGDYPGATNTQNDFSIIHGKLGTLADLEGTGFANAYSLGSTYNSVRKAVPGGAVGAPSTLGDYDYYKFTVPTGGAQVDLTVAPAIGVDTTQYAAGESRGANLTMQGGLYKNPYTGYIVRMYEDDNSPMRPNTNKLEYSGHLDSGDYVFWVEGRSPDYNWATGFDDWGTGGEYRVNLDVDRYPYANCGTIQGANHNFSISSAGFTATEREIRIGRTLGGTHYYRATGLRGTEYEHYVTGLPVDGSTIYVTIISVIDGVSRYGYATCTTSSAGEPEVYAPLPGSILPTSDTFYWKNNGAAITNYWLYVGTSLGGRQIHNSGELAGTTTGRFVTPLPTNGKTVYVRLWYKRDGTSAWNYKDTEYRASYNGDDAVWIQPAPGAALGLVQQGYWNRGLVDEPNDRYRVYVGPTYGSTTWGNSANIMGTESSYPVSGWGTSDYGATVWVRFLWRKGGVWKRSNHSYIAGSGPATIDAEATAPVPVGQ